MPDDAILGLVLLLAGVSIIALGCLVPAAFLAVAIVVSFVGGVVAGAGLITFLGSIL